jgi:hypothetical protein
MADYKETLRRGSRLVLTWLPVFTLLGSLAVWVDTRYMHRQISDTRFIDLQLSLVQTKISAYQRMLDKDEDLTEAERMDYDVSIEQMKDLLRERNRLLGVGE